MKPSSQQGPKLHRLRSASRPTLRQRMVSPLVLLLLVAASAAAPAAAQSATDSERRAAFAELLDGARLVGQFTVVNPSTGETMQRDDLYSVSRLLPGDGDVWVFEYSMSYGDNEANTLEIPVRVLFVEDTPLLTMSEQEVPGLGTFSVRLVFHGDRYGGMWSNGPVGGHMWGIIERDEAAAAEKAPPGD